jgi:multidrug efflux pump subunit AcrA (membrane-fusion protein)
MPAVITFLCLAWAAPPSPGPATPPLRSANAAQGGRQVQITHCLVSLMEDVQVPALEAGEIMSLAVLEGDLVSAGQLLAQIDDRQPKLDRLAADLQQKAAVAKAEDDIEVRFSEAAFAVATAELERALAVERRSPGGVTQQEIQKLQLAKHRDELQIERSKLEMLVAQMTADVQRAAVKSADDAIARRRIISPLDGVVVTLFHDKGEWVAAGESVVQVVRIDRLRVEGFLNATEIGPDEVAGRPVLVEVQLAGGRPGRLTGNVVYTSPLVQAGNKYRVRAEVENRTENGHAMLRPGLTATMTIQLEETAPRTQTVR